jgi:hypothetical protein
MDENNGQRFDFIHASRGDGRTRIDNHTHILEPQKAIVNLKSSQMLVN